MPPKHLILIGLGPHARRIYYPLIEKHAKEQSIALTLVVDVESQRGYIERYLSSRLLQPERLFFIEDGKRHSQQLDAGLAQLLTETTNQGCDGMIIASEASTHETYVAWALEHCIDVLTDKPPVAPANVSTQIDPAEAIFQRYLMLEQELKTSRSNLLIQCQRRSHVGYHFVRQYLQEFLQTYQIPISYINIYHADGMWGMPGELFERENHPYKYGYGKLMHSGYHFVDLFAWLAGVNSTIKHRSADRAELFVQQFRPSDFLHQIGSTDYQRLLHTERFQDFFTTASIEGAKQLGELDVFVQCQLKRDDFVVTTGSIELQQNSFSRRGWVEEAPDVYKGNGRVRHERVNIQVGPLLNIQVHSYQAYEIGKADVAIDPGEDGHEAHFDVHIYRNSQIVGGKPYEKVAIGKDEWQQHLDDQKYMGHNEQARETIFLDFLNGRQGTSHFSSHKFTNLLLAKIYRCMAQSHKGQIPYTTFPVEW